MLDCYISTNFYLFSWVVNKIVAERLIEIWPNIMKLVNHWLGLKKSDRPSSKSFFTVSSAVDDILLPAKLSFFSFIAGILEPYLKAYQTEKPMLPFLYTDLKQLCKKLLELIVKPDILAKCKSGLDFKNIDLKKSGNTKGNKVFIGYAATTLIVDLKKKDEVSHTKVN